MLGNLSYESDIYRGHFYQESLRGYDPFLYNLLTKNGFYPISRIGAGGHGEVYLGRYVKQELHDTGPLAAFQNIYGPREARKITRGEVIPSVEYEIASCGSPYVAQSHALASSNILDMEYLPCQAHFSPSNALELSIFLCEALLDVKDKTKKVYVHRDIKRDNIRLGEDGKFRLIDWGSARLEGTMSGPEGSTASAMAPESVRMHSISSKEDVWAIGIILFQCLGENDHPLFSKAEDIDIFLFQTKLDQLSKHTKNPELYPDVGLKFLESLVKVSTGYQSRGTSSSSKSKLYEHLADLLPKLLHPSPEQRLSLEEALCAFKRLCSLADFSDHLSLPSVDDSMSIVSVPFSPALFSPSAAPSYDQILMTIEHLREEWKMTSDYPRDLMECNEKLYSISRMIEKATLTTEEKRRMYHQLKTIRAQAALIPPILGKGHDSIVKSTSFFREGIDILCAEKESLTESLPETEKALVTQLSDQFKKDPHDPCFNHLPEIFEVGEKSYTLEYLPYPLQLSHESSLAEKFELAKQTLEAICLALRAMSRLTGKPIVHQDIQRQNLRRRENGEIILIDWGLAAPSGTLQSKVQGSLQTTAPECSVRPIALPAKDAWATGILMYNILSEAWHPLLEKTPEKPKEWLIEFVCTYGEPDIKTRDAFHTKIKRDIAMFLEIAPQHEKLLTIMQGLLELDPDRRLLLEEVSCSSS